VIAHLRAFFVCALRQAP